MRQPAWFVSAVVACSVAVGCTDDDSEPAPDGGSASVGGSLPTGPCDLGPLPAPLDGALRLPELPNTTAEREASTAAELEQAVAEPGTRVMVRGSIDQRVTIAASDVEVVIEDPAVTVRSLAIGQSVQRVRLAGGQYGSISTPLPADYYPELEYHPEYFAEDLTFDGIRADSSLDPDNDQALSLMSHGRVRNIGNFLAHVKHGFSHFNITLGYRLNSQ